MITKIRLTESDVKSVIKNAVKNIVNEYTDSELKRMYGNSYYDGDEEEFNEQPANNIVGENNLKLTEQDLHNIVKESVNKILCEIGDKHRFGLGKYGLAMDAASKAKSLGRVSQAHNLEKHGSDAFNKEFGTNDFQMDEFGQLRHKGEDRKERMYRPKSEIDRLNDNKGLQGGAEKYDNALRNNSYIKHAAQTAKAFPRKKMTSGLNAIDAVDKGIHGTV